MRNIYIIIVLLACVTTGCKKNVLTLTQYSLPTDKAYVRFSLLSPGTTSVMIKVNDVKVNGAVTSGSGGLFPSVTNSPDYASVPPNSTFRLSLPNAGTGNDSVLIYNGTFTVEAGKFYAVTLADTGIDRTVFAVEDKMSALADSGFFKIRLVNAMAKSPALNLVRVDSTSSTVVVRDTIARNIAFKSATDFIKSSIAPLPGYSFLRFRAVNASGISVSMTPPASSTINQRSVTIYAGGFANGTGIYSPTLSSLFIFNQ